jgi:hypothetical protein
LVGTGGLIVAPQSVLEKASGSTLVPVQPAGNFEVGATNTAILGNVTVSAADTGAGNIKNNASITNLYVIGKLTISDPTTSVGSTLIAVIGDIDVNATITATNIRATGNVTQAAASAITGILTTGGDFTSAVTGATAAVVGTLNVSGNASFTGAAAKIEALTVDGNLTASVLAADNGNVVVGGTTSITSLTPHATSGDFTFGKTATIGTLVSTSVTALTIVGTGDVTITTPGTPGTAAVLTKNGTGKLTLTNAVTVGATSLEIAGTGPVVLSAAPVISILDLIITNTAGVTFSDGLALTAAGNIEITTTGVIIVPATKAINFNSILELGPGTYTGLVGGASIAGDTGIISTGGSNGDGLRIGSATDGITLTSGDGNTNSFTPAKGGTSGIVKFGSAADGKATITLEKGGTSNGATLTVGDATNAAFLTLLGASTLNLENDAAYAGTLILKQKGKLAVSATGKLISGSTVDGSGLVLSVGANATPTTATGWTATDQTTDFVLLTVTASTL